MTQEQQPSPVKSVEVTEELWSIECTVDELQRDLCRVKEQIVMPGINWGHNYPETRIVRKYYRQAWQLILRIPIERPAPEFVINASDLSPKVIEELGVRADNPQAFGYILKQAVGRIFEEMDYDYYHQSVARCLKVRLES